MQAALEVVGFYSIDEVRRAVAVYQDEMRRIKSGSFDGVVERDPYDCWERQLLERMLWLRQSGRAFCETLLEVHDRFAAGEISAYWLGRLRMMAYERASVLRRAS